MPQIHEIIERYIAIFNHTDKALREAAMVEVFTEDCHYTDPHVSVSGVDGVGTFVSDVRARMPTAKFSLASPIDAHHDQARFQWSVTVGESPEPLGVGFDVVTLREGRIARVLGFIDKGREHGMRATASRYLSAWNEADPEKRQSILRGVFAEKCTYVDPMAALHGVGEIGAFIESIRQSFQGVSFVLGDLFDAHHDQARFTWYGMAEGVTEPIAIGFDVAVFENGRIRDVHGFIDRMPGA